MSAGVLGGFGRWKRQYFFNGDLTGTPPLMVDQLLEKSKLEWTMPPLRWLNHGGEVKCLLTCLSEKFVGASGSGKLTAQGPPHCQGSFVRSRDSLNTTDTATEGQDRPVY